MQSLGHALIGDPVYGNARVIKGLPAAARNFPRQALHAARLELSHPHSGATLRFASPLPADLQQLETELDQHAVAR